MKKLLKLSRDQRCEGELLRWAFYYTQSLSEHASKGNIKAVSYMVKHSPIQVLLNEALCFAAEKGHLEVVQCLVRAGADVHARVDFAVRWASHRGHLQVVQYLVRAGADVDVRDSEAERWAWRRGHFEVARCLRCAGMNICAQYDDTLRRAAK